MPDKKKPSLAEKFQEVARRSREIGNVATGKPIAQSQPRIFQGPRNTAHPKDVNLPINVGPKKKK